LSKLGEVGWEGKRKPAIWRQANEKEKTLALRKK
jgi:hypothetical protein